MAAVDVQHPVETTYVPAGPLKRSESQVLKQMKVEQVQQRLFHQQEPVRKLLDETDSLLSAAAVDRVAALEVIEQQQKAARNIGEDLMEDMLCLDSLANLFQEDRQVRKKALADIEALVEQVDSAKSMLMKRRKELEALAHADKEAAPLAPVAPAPAAPNERLAELRLQLELTSQTLPHAYVVSGFARGLKKEELTLELRGSTLKINALRLPTPEGMKAWQLLLDWLTPVERARLTRAAESAFLERTLRRAPTVEDFMAVGRGVFGQIREAIKLPMDVDRSKIQATCVDGQLRITLPRQRQPRRPPQFSW